MESFWEWFEQNIDGKWLTQEKLLMLMVKLGEMDSDIKFDIGNGWTKRDENGNLISKQEMIFVGNTQSSIDLVMELKRTAPELKNWEIVTRLLH